MPEMNKKLAQKYGIKTAKQKSGADKRYDYSNIWIKTLEAANIAYGQQEEGKYNNLIQVLIRSLYPNDRKDVKAWIKKNQPKVMTHNERRKFYGELHEKIVDLLDEKGYIQIEKDLIG